MLSVVKKSDGSTVVLGNIRMRGDEGDDGDYGDGDNGDDENGEGGDQGGSGQWWGKCGDHSGTNVNVSVSEVELPPDLDPMDIGQIILSDFSGNAILTGDLVNPSKSSVIKFKAKLAISGSQTGTTQAQSTVKHGKRTDRFTMIGSGIAANTKFMVFVNGKQAGTV